MKKKLLLIQPTPYDQYGNLVYAQKDHGDDISRLPEQENEEHDAKIA